MSYQDSLNACLTPEEIELLVGHELIAHDDELEDATPSDMVLAPYDDSYFRCRAIYESEVRAKIRGNGDISVLPPLEGVQ